MSKVILVPHDLSWEKAFEAEAHRVRSGIKDNVVAIHHIGSTSIPGIYAKPVIDILVEVHDITDVDTRSASMEALGYEAMGEFGIEGRRYFRKDDERGLRSHQIHVFEYGSDQVRRHIAFRDYLLANP